MWNTIIVAIAIFTAPLVMAQDDTCIRYGFDIDLPGASCADIYNKNPTSHGRSGYYVVETDHLFIAYCDMELDCGGTKGGWMRIADIDTSRGDTCPSGWTSYDNSYCTGGSIAGCYSAHFSTNSTSYSKVCGKAKGYQKGSMNGFYPSAYAHEQLDEYTPVVTSRSLDGVYVDGISITSGNPRKHVWTYAVGLSDDQESENVNCPCAKYPGATTPTYVGYHYYCESGNNDVSEFHNDDLLLDGSGSAGILDDSKLYSDDPLWDGAGCLPENSCCYRGGMPWFLRQFPIVLKGDVEVRICSDQDFSDEAVVVEQIQLYVQ